jgi:hypothetical protein
MHIARLRALSAGLTAIASLAAVPAWATSGDAGPMPSPDACRKNVHAMGASMSEAEVKKVDWGTAYHFVIRTNGIDYDVICDAKTGLVKDVARRGSTADTQ